MVPFHGPSDESALNAALATARADALPGRLSLVETGKIRAAFARANYTPALTAKVRSAIKAARKAHLAFIAEHGMLSKMSDDLFDEWQQAVEDACDADNSVLPSFEIEEILDNLKE